MKSCNLCPDSSLRSRMTGTYLIPLKKRNSLVPSFLSGGQNRNDDRRKEYNMTLSEESGIGYQKIHLILTFFAQILHSTPYFFILLFLTAFYDRSRMTGIFLYRFVRNFFTFLPTLAPSDGFAGTLAGAKRLTCFPISGNIFCMNHFIILQFYLYKNLFYLCLLQ